MDDVSLEMKKLLDFIDGKESKHDFTIELDETICEAKRMRNKGLIIWLFR